MYKRGLLVCVNVFKFHQSSPLHNLIGCSTFRTTSSIPINLPTSLRRELDKMSYIPDNCIVIVGTIIIE